MSGGNSERDLVAEEEERLRRSGIAPRRTGRRRGMDDGTRRLAFTAGGLGAALVAVVGGWTLLQHRPHGIPVIEPPPGPIRVKPEQPGGLQVSALGDAAATGNGGATSLAPPPEEAHPELLAAEIAAAKRAEQAEQAGTAGRDGTGVAGQGVTGTGAQGTGAQGTGAQGAGAQGAGAAPVAGSAPAPVVASPGAAAPAVAPAPVERNAGRTAAAGPAVAAPAAGTGAEAPAAEGGGTHAVQLAALDSEAAARTEWARLSRMAPELLGGHEPAVVPVERDGKRFFRLRTGGFDTLADAIRFCAALKQKGIGCTVAEF